MREFPTREAGADMSCDYLDRSLRASMKPQGDRTPPPEATSPAKLERRLTLALDYYAWLSPAWVSPDAYSRCTAKSLKQGGGENFSTEWKL